MHHIDYYYFSRIHVFSDTITHKLHLQKVTDFELAKAGPPYHVSAYVYGTKVLTIEIEVPSQVHGKRKYPARVSDFVSLDESVFWLAEYQDAC